MRFNHYIYRKKSILLAVFLFDLIGQIFFSPSKIFRKKQSKQKEIEKILIFKPDHIGDVLLATPCLTLLRKKFPRAGLVFCCSSKTKEIVEDNPHLDQILVFDFPWQKQRADNKFFSLILGTKEIFRFIKKIRKEKFDLFICLREDLPSIVIGFLARIPYRIGYGLAGGGFLLTKKIEPSKQVHQIEHLLKIVKEIDLGNEIQLEDLKPRIYLDEDDLKKAKEILEEYSLENHFPLICFHIGAGLPTKKWPKDRYKVLAEKLIEKYQAKIILIGGEDSFFNGNESQIANRKLQIASCKSQVADCKLKDIISLAGKLSIKQTTALLKYCHLFIGNDSALGHLAASQDIPVISIFSGTDYSFRWKPFGEKVIVIEKDLSCKGCQKKFCQDLKCLKSISVEEVIEAVKLTEIFSSNIL